MVSRTVSRMVLRSMLAVSALAAYACPALAQQRQPAPAQQPSSEWSRMPRMELERQFAGPLQDTIVQRWRDPVDGTICYIYLPITAEHTQPNASGFVQYGANTIGSVSCLAAPASAQAKPAPLPRAQRPPAATDGNSGDQKAAH